MIHNTIRILHLNVEPIYIYQCWKPNTSTPQPKKKRKRDE